MANKFDIDPDLVRKLSDLLGETGLSEIEYESAGRRIRVARNIAGTGPVVTFDGGSAPATAAPAASGDEAEEAERHGKPITAPMVGTVFLSPEPGAEPFVKAGDTILIPDGDFHQVHNTGFYAEDDLEFICVFDGGRNH